MKPLISHHNPAQPDMFRPRLLDIINPDHPLVKLAASPAPAQTTTTLLDIRSPATADPPSTSLLTVSDAGDLWIRGQLVEYAYPGTITLDPSRLYWTLRDSAGNVLWALEAYNPTTGISTGNLLTVGTFESYCYDAEQEDAIFRVKTAAGLTVLALNQQGRATAAGLAPARETPTSTPPPATYTPLTPDAYASAPDFSGSLTTYLNQVAQPPHTEIRVSIPQAQARIYYGMPSGNPQRQLHDVTNMSWRRRWDPDKTTLANYGVVRYGVRCVNANSLRNQSILEWAWAAYDPGLQMLDVYEYDVKVYWNENSQAGDWMGVVDVAWSVVPANPPPDMSSPGRVHITATLQDSPQDPGYDDSDTALESDLFLYTVDFTGGHPWSGSFPRNDLDARTVHVGCQLVPGNTPNLDYIELTLWDPAYANRAHKRIFRSDTDPIENRLDIVSAMWDGRLWTTEDGEPDPENPYDYYYTQASDIFMEATVHWVALDPERPWETADDNTFPEDRYAIIVSDGTQPVSSTRTNFAWISAGNATTAPSMPSLSAWIERNGDAELPATADWSLQVWYTRPDRCDWDMYPGGSPGYETVNGGDEWYVDFGSTFRGGTARMTCDFDGKRCDHQFHIRGYNASREATIAHINQNNNGHSYAWAMAQVESELHHFNPPGTGGQQLPGPNELTDLVAQPNRGDSTPYGWGLFQLTRWDLNHDQQYEYPEPQHLWNWKTNTTVAIQILDDCKNTAQIFENAVSRTFNYPYGWDYVAAPNVLSFSSLEAATIQGFCSWSMSWEEYQLIAPNGLPRWYHSTCWILHYSIIDGMWYEFYGWEFVENTRNYVHRVDAAVRGGQ